MAFPPVGKPAPSFTLKDQNGHDVSLQDFRGKRVVIYFYPKAMTPGCTVQACGLRDHFTELGELDVVVLGISPDAPERLKKFEDKEKLNFTLLSDPDHVVAEQYGVDRDGALAHVMDQVKTKTHDRDVIEWITSNLDQ